MRISQETRNRINQWIDAHAEETISDLQDFSRIRSVSRADLGKPGAPFGPECREMLDYALQRGAEYGFQTADHEGYCGSVYIGDIDHAIGIIGHLDVVPEGDQWIYPPYAATRVGDFLIGRGVDDNKAACVMGLALMRMFTELGLPLRHGIRVVMGCSEETGMADMHYFEQTQTMPVVSLVPDSGFPVNYAQKGTLRGTVSIPCAAPIVSFSGGEVENMVPPHAKIVLSLPLDVVKAAFDGAGYGEEEYQLSAQGEGTIVVAKGIAAHAAKPEHGKSAIHMLSTAMAQCGLLSGAALDAMRAVCEMSKDYYGVAAGIDCEDPESGKTSMVIGVAKTENGRISLSLDCRLSIATDLDAVQANYRAYCAQWGFEIEELEVGRPFYMPKDDPRVLALMEVYQSLTGDMSPAYTMGGGTYSRCLQNALTFGPGFNEERPRPEGIPAHHGGAHAPDEYVYIPDLLRALAIYAVSILELDAIV